MLTRPVIVVGRARSRERRAEVRFASLGRLADRTSAKCPYVSRWRAPASIGDPLCNSTCVKVCCSEVKTVQTWDLWTCLDSGARSHSNGLPLPIAALHVLWSSFECFRPLASFGPPAFIPASSSVSLWKQVLIESNVHIRALEKSNVYQN